MDKHGAPRSTQATSKRSDSSPSSPGAIEQSRMRTDLASLLNRAPARQMSRLRSWTRQGSPFRRISSWRSWCAKSRRRGDAEVEACTAMLRASPVISALARGSSAGLNPLGQWRARSPRIPRRSAPTRSSTCRPSTDSTTLHTRVGVGWQHRPRCQSGRRRQRHRSQRIPRLAATSAATWRSRSMARRSGTTPVRTMTPSATGPPARRSSASSRPSASCTASRCSGRGWRDAAPSLPPGSAGRSSHEVDVCNLSLGTSKADLFGALHELADQAYFRNIILVAAANNMPVPTYPALYASVISVAACTGEDPELFYYNPQPPVEFGAPGINIRVAWRDGSG